MESLTKIKAGEYLAPDGRFIVKEGNNWYVTDDDGNLELGPLPTLKLAKQYVLEGTISGESHNYSTQYGRRQSKKEFNAYLASEAKNGNPLPLILYIIFLVAICLFFVVIRGY